MAKPVTREEKENSKREFDELNNLINNELKGLENWVLKTAQPKLINLQKLIRGDLTDPDTKWGCEAEIRIGKTLMKQGQTKIDYIDKLVKNLNDQVLRAPIKVKDTDDDTSESRLYQARAIDEKVEESKEAFDRWANSILMIQQNFKDLTEKKKPKRDDSDDREESKRTSNDKGSTSDAKGLKPDVLDTSMPQLTIKNWFKSFDNYRHASGWGQGDNHRTQLAYLRMCLSEEIRTAVDFDNLATVDKALYDIKAYMINSVMPLTLQRLDLFRYSPPQGQSQSATTQTVVELFRNCDGFTITPEEVLIICLLNTIQEKSVLVKVQEAIDSTTTWETVRNLIVKIDSTSRISDEFKQRKLRASGAAAGVKACRACGKKGHMAATCTVPKSQLKCKFCETEKSHNTAACLKKKKNDKKKDDNKGGKTDTTVVKTTSQDARDTSNTNKRDLSHPRSNRSPQRFGNQCAQVRVVGRGDTSPENSSDSEEDEEYNTPPETMESDNDLEEENDDPNEPENSDDEDNEVLQNTAANDSAIETANLRNFPDLLRLNRSGWNTNTSGMTQPTEGTFPTSECSGAKPKQPSTNALWPRNNTPPCDRPPDPWRGLISQDQLMCDNTGKTFKPR